MLGLFFASSGTDRVVALGFAYSAALTGGALILLGLVRRRTGAAAPLAGALNRATGCAIAAGAAARAVVDVLPSTSRSDALVAVVASGAVALSER